jgi:hypothetical protein
LAESCPAELSRLLTAPRGADPASGRCPGRRRRRGQVGRAVRRSPLPVLVHHWVSAQAGSSSGPVSSRPVSARRVSSHPVSARRVSVRDRPVRPSGVRPSGVQPVGVRLSVLWRPSRLRSARPWPLGPLVRQDLHGWNALGSAWLAAYPSGSVDGSGLGRRRRCEGCGSTGREGGSRGSRTWAGSRSGSGAGRARLLTDQGDHPAWVARRRRLPWAGRATTLRGRC